MMEQLPKEYGDMLSFTQDISLADSRQILLLPVIAANADPAGFVAMEGRPTVALEQPDLEAVRVMLDWTASAMRR